MGKIIVISNPKGGVGKSTLCSVLATYLSENGREVGVIDADIQQSLVHHRQRDKKSHPERKIPWDIRSFVGMSSDEVSAAMERIKGTSFDILIDCPGNIVDPNLSIIYTLADIAVVPIHYDSDTLDATKMFCEMFKERFSAKMFFIPNGIVLAEEQREHIKQERDRAVELLKTYGWVTPRIKRSIIIGDYSTLLPLTYYQRNAVRHAFEPIMEELQKGGVD